AWRKATSTICRRVAVLILRWRGAASRSHDALPRERVEVVPREPEPPAVDLLVVRARRGGAGARHPARRQRELRHDPGHPEGVAAGTGNGNEVVPGPQVLVLEEVLDAVDPGARDVRRVQPGQRLGGVEGADPVLH